MDKKYRKMYWTDHVKLKMKQYGLSRSKLLNVIYKPERIEQGIASGTVAVMQTKKTYASPKKIVSTWQAKKPAGEIWLMYQDTDNQRNIISAWRYPGVSKAGENIPVPAEIYQELYGKISS